MEVKNLGNKLINIAGLIAIISGGVHVFLMLLLFILEQWNISRWMEETIGDLIHSYSFGIFYVLAGIAVGIFLMVSALRLKDETKPLVWSAVVMILSGALLFEFRGGGMLGGATAGIMGLVGGGMRLYVAVKEHLEVG